ncbi:Uncharacterised protein [Nocardia otitidiscaviarum]|uniref:Uncharacterized protein n=1 Tax=Nocardia otitidiscaviarum TaxID=1823 RepID=A0A379JMW5_9NOCA|nr:hypothetical protein [Nocardia otitidiscaviarum]SUD49571.1 Uncharacterised protein [Nocardia otitidiscaviarum]
MDEATAARLARLVLKRRQDLGVSRRQVSLTGGPTEPTMLKIERGQARRMEPDTMRKLDFALRWEPGTAAAIVAGDDPAPLQRGRGRHVAVGPPLIEVSAETIGQLVRAAQELTELAPGESRRMQDATERLNTAIQPLYAQYVTKLLEANRRQGGALAPLVALLGPFLDRPVGPADHDWEDAAYRRWLAGMQVEGIDDAMRRRFEARLEEDT